MRVRLWFALAIALFIVSPIAMPAEDIEDASPGQSAIAASNDHTLPLGGQENEGRLKRIIQETVRPQSAELSAAASDSADLLAWSERNNGLKARIDYISARTAVFVRLKNVSDQPLSVLMGNPGDEKATPLFELHTRQGTGPWRQNMKADRYARYFSAPLDPWADEPDAHAPRSPERKSVDRPWVTLKPGEDCVALFRCNEDRDSAEANRMVRVVLRQPDAGTPGRWSGVLETRPRLLELSAKQSQALRAAVPFPDHFPALSYDYSGVINQWVLATPVERLAGSNRPLIDVLAIYEPLGVSQEFQQRMRAEKIVPMKLMLASIAAAAGSEEAALFFLETMKDTDCLTTANLHDALWLTYRNCQGRPPDWQRSMPPDWLVELCLTILSDERLVTGLEKARRQTETSMTLSACETSRLVEALGDIKCPKAVPLLIERVTERKADWATLHALGQIGDARAAPVLMEAIREKHFDKYGCEQAVYALGMLKARDAVPMLLEDIDSPCVIRALQAIGDPRALPALRAIVAARGAIVRKGEPPTPEQDAERLFAAQLALAHFDTENETQRLIEMLSAPALTVRRRYDLVLLLGSQHDPRTIAHLVKIIKTDSDYYTIHMAIQGLAGLKYKAAVEGLIECFDVTFPAEDLGKGEKVTPDTYRKYIARGLQELTGQSFGADKGQWLAWWKEQGSQGTEVK